MVGAFHGWKRCALLAALAIAGCDKADQTEPSVGSIVDSERQDAAESLMPAPAAPRPAELDKFIADLCGGSVGIRPEALLTADFNADGKTDYVLSENRLCAGAEGGWGRAGPQNDFLVSSSTGYALFQGFVTFLEQANIKKRESGDVIQFAGSDTSSDGCGDAFTITWSWNGRKLDLTDRRNAKGQKVDEAGCLVSASSSLPIKVGYYGYADVSCAVSLRSYDGITISDRIWRDFDGDYPIRPIRNLGGKRYQFGDSYTIEIIDADRFVGWVTGAPRTETERRFIWCAEKGPE